MESQRLSYAEELGMLKLLEQISSRCSINTIVGIVIFSMGLMAMLLVLFSGFIHRNLAIEDHRIALSKLANLKTKDLINDLRKISVDLGSGMQSEPAIRKVVQSKDENSLTALLNNQFHQYFVTASVIKLERLTIFDNDFNLIAQSTEGASFIDKHKPSCPELIKTAKQRHGSARTKPISSLCLVKNKLLHSTLVAIGGLRIIGYIEIAVDPTQNLIPTESALGMPISIRRIDGEIIYKSSNWPNSKIQENILKASHEIRTSNNQPALVVTVAQDIKPLQSKAMKAWLWVILIVGTITISGALIAMYILRQTTLLPLSALAKRLQQIHGNQFRLQEQIEPYGAKEISQLGHEFNKMASELDKAYATMEQMAFVDPLTKLPNRNLLHEYMGSYIAQVCRSKGHFAFLLMDLDRFKFVNDTLGHETGDKLLIEVGKRLHHVLRGTDIVTHIDRRALSDFKGALVVRLGGDEFVAVLPDIDCESDAWSVVQELALALENPFNFGAHQFSIGVSIGIALYPQHGTDTSTLMRHADLAMYQAKKSRCGHAFYDPAHEIKISQDTALERDLVKSIENKELILHIQPQIDLTSRQLAGAEVLVRWQHPETGLIMPVEFIAIAEQSGLIHHLSEYILERALQNCDRWRKNGYNGTISVNLSPINLDNPGLCDMIRSALEKYAVPPEKLILELTENAVMEDPIRSLKVLNEIDDMGIRLAVDDFGTGYFSLANLKKFPVHEIKIDRTFVCDMLSNTNDSAIVHAAISLAHELGMSVVAEGVEDKETLDQLTVLGCDRAQGYHISRPLSLEEFDTWI